MNETDFKNIKDHYFDLKEQRCNLNSEQILFSKINFIRKFHAC